MNNVKKKIIMVLLILCVTMFARYKLPTIREICICISNLNIHMRSSKKNYKIICSRRVNIINIAGIIAN